MLNFVAMVFCFCCALYSWYGCPNNPRHIKVLCVCMCIFGMLINLPFVVTHLMKIWG